MVIKKIAIIERNKQQGRLLVDYLKARGLEVRLLDKISSLQEAQGFLGTERFDLLLLDIAPQEGLSTGEIQKIDAEFCLSLTRALKNNPQFQDLVIILLTSEIAIPKIAQAIEAGVDNIIIQEPQAGSISESIGVFFNKITFREKNVLDLNLINFLLQISSQAIREDFFVLAPTIFNRLFLDKFRPIIGATVVDSIMQRLEDLVSPQYSFMAKIKFQEGRISMEEVEKASKEVSVQHLSFAFRDYIYAFIHLVRTLTSDILIERWDWERGT